jgi:REP element-mobilizing transposase RayT
MASYTQLYLHCVWATWDRLPLITPEVETPLYTVIAGKCREFSCTPLAIGGIDDHIHVLVRLSPKIAVARLIGEMKGVSSHAVTHAIRPPHFFKWQRSYGAFTISQRSVSQVCAYILAQKSHHAHRTLINALEYCADPDDSSDTPSAT